MQVQKIYGFIVLPVLMFGTLVFHFVTRKKDSVVNVESSLKKFDRYQYVKESCDKKIDALLTALDLAVEAKNIIKSGKLDLILEHLGGQNLKQTFDGKTQDLKFEVDKEFSYNSWDGRKLTVTVRQTKDVMTEVDRWTDSRGAPKTASIIRTFSKKGVKVVTTVGVIKSTCTYKRKLS